MQRSDIKGFFNFMWGGNDQNGNELDAREIHAGQSWRGL